MDLNYQQLKELFERAKNNCLTEEDQNLIDQLHILLEKITQK
jgi:hypothetical protein